MKVKVDVTKKHRPRYRNGAEDPRLDSAKPITHLLEDAIEDLCLCFERDDRVTEAEAKIRTVHAVIRGEIEEEIGKKTWICPECGGQFRIASADSVIVNGEGCITTLCPKCNPDRAPNRRRLVK